MLSKFLLIVAALTGGLGVAIGAYHAHGLEESLRKQGLSDEMVVKRLDQCEVAVRYQMYHALALLAVGLLAGRQESTGVSYYLLAAAGLLFILGVKFFSGGLYLFVFAGNGFHWSIVPLGGMSLIAGWIALGVAAAVGRATAWRTPRETSSTATA